MLALFVIVLSFFALLYFFLLAYCESLLEGNSLFISLLSHLVLVTSLLLALVETLLQELEVSVLYCLNDVSVGV